MNLISQDTDIDLVSVLTPINFTMIIVYVLIAAILVCSTYVRNRAEEAAEQMGKSLRRDFEYDMREKLRDQEAELRSAKFDIARLERTVSQLEKRLERAG